MSPENQNNSIRKTLLLGCGSLLLTLSLATAASFWVLGSWVFHGPSESARDALALSLLDGRATAWIPGLFLDDAQLRQLQTPAAPLEPDAPEEAPVVSTLPAPQPEDPWAGHPDGIRIEAHTRRTFTAHVMLIRDPSSVYLATSADSFSLDRPGARILNQMKAEGAIAAINAGAFNDDGSSGTHVGSLPIGLVISEGRILWDDGRSYNGFMGMTEDNRLYVSAKITAAEAKELKIRDGCCFGPVLIKDGQINEKVNSMAGTRNSRSAIGQRSDGTMLFVCIDGRQAGSMGAVFSDLLALLQDLGAVNACALDGGASTVLAYKDTGGLYGKAGQNIICSSYSLFQASPRRMPTFFMVRPPEQED